MSYLVAIRDFSDEQTEVYNGLNSKLNNNADFTGMIQGPAGTGKTLILLQLSLQNTNKEGLFLIYTNALKKFLVSALSDTVNHTEMNTEVETFHSWLFRTYRHTIPNGTAIVNNNSFEKKATQILNELYEVVDDNIIDFVLVDEGQDFDINVFRFLKKIAKKLIFVADANQSLYTFHGDFLEGLKNNFNPHTYELLTMIRISPKLAKLLSSYTKSYEELKVRKRETERNPKKDSQPIWYNSIDLESFLEYYSSIYALGYLKSGSNLGILCHHNNDVDYIHSLMSNLLPDENVIRVRGNNDGKIDFSSSSIFCLTIHSSKGLEFDNILYVHKDSFPKDNNEINITLYNNMAYTGYTRAKQDLIIYSLENEIPLQEYMDLDYLTIFDELPTLEPDDSDLEEDLLW